MTKQKLNLRNVATIVACLAVTIFFASCDKTNPDDGNSGSYNVGALGGTVWSQHPDNTDYWYGEMGVTEQIIPRSRSYNNSWIFNPDGTFVFTMRWLYNQSGTQYGGALVCYGNYNVISKSQFKTSNVKTNETTGIYYGKLTGWHGNASFTCDYEFMNDPAAGDGIRINIHSTSGGSENIEFDTWRTFWVRKY